MTEKISILDLLFRGCDDASTVAARISALQPEYNELTSNFNGRSSNDFANRVFAVAKDNNNLFRAEGAIAAGANKDYQGTSQDLFFLRSLCIRLGYIDPLNLAYEIKFCY